ncbi:hypothetical protein L596_006368 [Steinernema carpocapsae]|nr:hypothetical protein L596_006368 [Steinernema carpocapsae]
MTLYSMPQQMNRDVNGQQMWSVTKTVDLGQCKTNTSINYGYAHADRCYPKSEQNRANDDLMEKIHRSTSINYVYSDKRVERIEMLGMYVVPNLVRSAEAELVSTTFTVVNYVKSKKIHYSSSIEGPKNPTWANIQYSDQVEKLIEKFEMQGDKALQGQQSPFVMDKHAKKQKFLKFLKIVATAPDDESKGIKHKATMDFMEMVQLARTMTMDELKTMWEKADRMLEEAPRATKFYIQVLTSAGTYNTVKMFVDKVMEPKIPTPLAAQAIKTLNVQNPSTLIVDQIIRLCEQSHLKKSDFTQQSCWFTAGALINKWSKMDQQMSESQARDYFMTIMKIFHGAKDMEDKMFALKIVGNAGLAVGVDELQKIICDRKEIKLVRMQAVDSLRLLRVVIPQQIQRILLPVFQNPQEIPEVRMAAFFQILHTQPGKQIIGQIVRTISQEKDTQVVSFVVSMMEKFAESKNPCESDLAEDLKHVMSIVHTDENRRTSLHTYSQLPYWSQEEKAGVYIYYGMTHSETSALVNEVAGGIDMILQNDWLRSFVEFGTAQENMEKVVESLMEYVNEQILSIKWDEPVKIRGERFRKTPREMLMDLKKNLKIESRLNKEPAAAVIYLRFQNMDYAVFNFNMKSVDTAISMLEKAMKGGALKAMVKKFLNQYGEFDFNMGAVNYEALTKAPTCMGSPLIVKQYRAGLFHFDGKVEAKFDHAKELKMKLHVAYSPVHLLTSQVWSLYGAVGVWTEHALEINQPTDNTIKWEGDFWTKGKITIAQKQPANHQHLLGIYSHPVTYMVENMPEHEKMGNAKTIHDRRYSHTEHRINRTYMNFTSLPIHVQGHGYDFVHFKKPMDIFFTGRNTFKATLKPHDQSADNLQAVIEYQMGEKTSGFSKKPEFEDFYESRATRNYFTLDDMEDEDEDRISEFEQRIRSHNAEKKNQFWVGAEVSATGNKQERKAKMEFHFVLDDQKHCQAKAQMFRTPVPEWKETEDWEMTVDYNGLYPTLMTSLEGMKKKHREMTSTLTFNWGSDKQHVVVKMQGEQGKHLRDLLKHKMKKSSLSAMEKRDLVKRMNHMNQFKFHATYKLDEDKQEMLNGFWWYLTYSHYFTMVSEVDSVSPNTHELFAKVTFDPQEFRYMNFTVHNWKHNLTMFEYKLPYSLPEVANVFTYFNVAGNKTDECIVGKKDVKTFKKMILRTPSKTSDCYSVYISDCTDEDKESKFAVLGKLISKNSAAKKLRIIVPKMKIDAEVVHGSMKVIINDESMSAPELEKYETKGLIIRENVLEFENQDIYVLFDGEIIKSRVASIYKNRKCGLCSAEKKDNKFILADNDLSEDLNDFHQSFLLKDSFEKCSGDRDEIRSEIRSEEDTQYIDNEDEDDDQIELQKFTAVGMIGKLQCFSKEPATACPKGTKVQTERISMDVVCASDEDEKIQEAVWKAQEKKGPIDLDYIERVHETYYVRNMKVAKSCSRQ